MRKFCLKLLIDTANLVVDKIFTFFLFIIIVEPVKEIPFNQYTTEKVPTITVKESHGKYFHGNNTIGKCIDFIKLNNLTKCCGYRDDEYFERLLGLKILTK